MPGDADRAVGVIVVSLWREDYPSGWSLRGRVTYTSRDNPPDSVSTAVADVDGLLAAVKDGVEAFLARPPDPAHG